jgi:hypothetical protein
VVLIYFPYRKLKSFTFSFVIQNTVFGVVFYPESDEWFEVGQPPKRSQKERLIMGLNSVMMKRIEKIVRDNKSLFKNN